MTQSIVVQGNTSTSPSSVLNFDPHYLNSSFSVGQAGNQIGHRFWDLALREHASVNKVENLSFLIAFYTFLGDCRLFQKGLYDSALSTFFVNGDAENSVGKKQRVSGLKARVSLAPFFCHSFCVFRGHCVDVALIFRT